VTTVFSKQTLKLALLLAFTLNQGQCSAILLQQMGLYVSELNKFIKV